MLDPLTLTFLTTSVYTYTMLEMGNKQINRLIRDVMYIHPTKNAHIMLVIRV